MAGSTMPKRAYRSPLREQQAARTRERIVEAAATLFSARGFAGTTMADIARAADVSVESVHATGAKAFLLVEAFRTRYMGEGGWSSILEQDVAQDIFAIDDREAALVALEDFLVSAHGRSADLMVQLRSAVAVEPVVAEMWADLQANKVDSFVHSARWMVRIGIVEGPLDDVELRSLAATLNVVMSAETYLQLTHDWGLDEDAYRATMRRWICAARP